MPTIDDPTLDAATKAAPQVPPNTPLRVPFGGIDVSGYTPTDGYFGAAYIDADEWRETPYPHRHVHGGFVDTDTRFTFYFTPTDDYQGRLYAPIEGAHGGHDDSFGGPMGEIIGGLRMTARLGGYMVDTNQGHIGDDVDPRAGDDTTLYGFRATNESARLSKFVAAQLYGAAPHHAYVWGGSGGGRRSPGCLENGSDVFDGAMPFMGGGNIVEPGVYTRVKGSQVMSFGSMFNVQRVLKDKIAQVTDAMAPGGSKNPFEGLDAHQREELANLYRLGYPRGDEFMIGQPMGQIWLWSSMADDLQKQDPDYFEAFWTKPGYVGHDAPHLLADDLINVEATVSRLICPRDLMEDQTSFDGPQWAMLKTMAMLLSSHGGLDMPVAVQLSGLEGGYRLGAGLRITSGAAAGRQLYALQAVDDVFQGDGVAEANLQRFTGVEVGDTIRVDNRAFLAFCYYYRHHLMEDQQFDFLRVDGVPLYPQHPVPDQSPLMGVPYTGAYEGKLLWVHHTHDASLWPPQGLLYREAVLRNRGQDALDNDFCLRWADNAEHIPPFMLPSDPGRATSTWLIDYGPYIEQSLLDLQDWVERSIKPAPTAYHYEDGKVLLPPTAAERGGIQPVVRVTANGSSRAEVAAGSTVTLEVEAEAPPAGGGIVSVQWDLEGKGTFEMDHQVDGSQSVVRLSITHVYPERGTYFATARVACHRESKVGAIARVVPNLASARIVVS